MNNKRIGTQVFVRLLANLIQAATFIILGRTTESREIGILSFLLSISAFLISAFDFGISKKLILGESAKYLRNSIESAIRSSVPFVILQTSILVIIDQFFIDLAIIFFIWSLSIASDRLLDFYLLVSLSLEKDGIFNSVTLLRRIVVFLIMLVSFIYDGIDLETLSIYISSTLFFNFICILILRSLFKKELISQEFSARDLKLQFESRSFSLLTIQEQYKNLDILFLMFFFGPPLTGEYALIARIFNPMILIANSYFTEMLRGKRSKSTINQFTTKDINGYLIFAIIVLVINLYSGQIIKAVYGYSNSSMEFFFHLLSVSISFYFFSGVMESLFILDHASNFVVKLQFYIFVSSLVLTILAFVSENLKLGLLLYSLAYLVKFLVLLFFTFVKNQKQGKNYL